MVFASLTFLYIFLPLNIVLYYSTKNPVWRNIILIAFSLFFYAWGEPVWILLLIFSSFIDYAMGLVIEKYRGSDITKLALACSLVVNIALLSFFKYSGFIYENINALLGTSLVAHTFSLPIGISFYTFQTVSYTVDVYRGDVKAQRSFGKFLMFVSLYHQLVAGPIVRYSHVANEIDNRRTSMSDISGGINRLMVGLTKKVLVANTAGALAAKYLGSDLSALSPAAAWFGIAMFSIQIYYDFSGYSDMAIGMGRMFGFHYYENFNYPYIARSATDFWRRWHMSLGTFFRDYVYIPLGGNRKHQMLNLLIVWFLTGLWHGASWNFVIWGVYFGLLIIIEKLFLGKVLEALPKIFGHIYLLFAAVVGWVFFYFTDMDKMTQFLRIIFGLSANPADPKLAFTLSANILLIIAAVIFSAPLLPYLKKKAALLPEKAQVFIGWGQIAANIIMLLISTALLVGQSYNPFLYFRF